MNKQLIIEYFDQLAIKYLMYEINQCKDIVEFSTPIAHSLKLLATGNLYENSTADAIAYNEQYLLENRTPKKEEISHMWYKKINNIIETPGALHHMLNNNYFDTPKHIVKRNDSSFGINWNRFNAREHNSFIKEAISHLCVNRISNVSFVEFWDGTGLVLNKVNNFSLNEGSSLNCNKKPYSYASNNFKKIKKILENIIIEDGFYLQEIYSAGSLRRKKSIIGDLDFIVFVNGHKETGRINNLREEKHYEKYLNERLSNAVYQNISGKNKKQVGTLSQFEMNEMQCDVFTALPSEITLKRFWWTGSAPHNARVMYEGFKNNKIVTYKYMFDKDTQQFLYPKHEREIFETCKLSYVSPNHRK